MSARRLISVLGATGSIGDSTLDVVARHPERFAVVALAAHRQWRKLATLCHRFRPPFAALLDPAAADLLQRELAAAGLPTRVLTGEAGVCEAAALPEADTVVAAIVGAAGLGPTLAAARAGKRILLANKEALVIGGAAFMTAVAAGGASLVPVDSEHNAIFQCLPRGYAGEPKGAGVRRILLTASGGPFRDRPLGELARVTPDEACAHPNWVMGRKISVDSATMMNKGLEIIEAHWLFGVPASAIEVVIHPQSVIHSLVEYRDGSVLAQLGNPDMRTPIAQALAHPDRIDAGVLPLDLARAGPFTFEAPDLERFPALGLAYDALQVGGTAPALLNAANEIAVAAFLAGRIRFTDIAATCAHVLATVPVRPVRELADALAADGTARAAARAVGPRGSAVRCSRGVMDLAIKLLAFLVVLGVLVVFHELGHYLVARWCGVKVTRFSVGFGRVIWSRRLGAGGTEWAISAVPLGGYVKMADEREGEVEAADLPHAFNRQSVWRRIAIVGAGPVANLLLAVLLFAGTYVAGVPGQRAIVAAPPEGTPAAATALREGDLVSAVDGVAVQSWQDLRWRLLRASGANEVVLSLVREDGSSAATMLSLAAVTPADWEGNFMPVLGLKADFGPPLIDEVVAGKPAAGAGLRGGDRILAIDGVAVRSPADVAAQTHAKPGMAVRFRVEREGTEFDVDLVTEVGDRGGRKIGLAGVRLKVDPARADQLAITVRYGPIDALGAGLRKTLELSLFTLRMLGRIVVGEASVKNISGPITLADFAGQSAQAGTLVFVGYLALISISLGVLNLLPVPLLDGGHLLYYFAELIKGSPVSDRAFEVGQRIGMAVLAMLMALALFNDLSRLF